MDGMGMSVQRLLQLTEYHVYTTGCGHLVVWSVCVKFYRPQRSNRDI